ncbi:M50 family metallopeptidase [Luedemannella flava]|uniref:M50 family metallopeptidase n=1 Tax=Luedemannella flava TaxID=349316 RepID=A0ABP4YS44_9ACTN
MLQVAGIVAFALTIFVSVCLHEAGHMLTAKAFGMKVTEYFAGFGPKLWSFRRGETEYGLKGIPLGGYVKIVGMTPHDEDVAPEDEHRAMWRRPVWQRTIVLVAGSATHMILAVVGIWLMAMTYGMPNPALPKGNLSQPAVVKVEACAVVDENRHGCLASDPSSPAAAAGFETGDRITAVNGTPISTWEDAVKTIQALPAGTAAKISVDRAGAPLVMIVRPAAVQRAELKDDGSEGAVRPASAIGISGVATIPANVTYGPVDAVGVTVDRTGDLFTGTFTALKKFPEKVPKLWTAITGGERDPDTPVSVVGVSRLGGEAVEHGLWSMFWGLFIGFNFFVGIFNLLPLLPLDGGHLAVIWFEKVRSWIYRLFKRPDPGRVNYMKLMPLTYAVILVFGAITLLTVGADIVNPVTLFPR